MSARIQRPFTCVWLVTFFVLVIFSSTSYGQLKNIVDSLTVDEVVITDEAIIKNSTSIKSENTTTHPQLDRLSVLYVRNYGAGSSSTVSMWGGSANHTLVTWEEVPINNPMLGLTDLSLLPPVFAQKYTVKKGAHSVTEGNNAVAGIIDYGYDSSSDTNQINIQLGSWKARTVSANLHHNKNRFAISASPYYAASKNDFTYRLGQREVVNTNADYTSYGSLGQAMCRLPKNNNLKINFWINRTERGIPPLTTQTRSKARQDDINNKIKISWNKRSKRSTTKSHVAFQSEENNYTDSLSQIYTSNTFFSAQHKTTYTYFSDNSSVTAGYEGNYISASTQSYEETQDIRQIALFGSITSQWRKQLYNLSIRKEWRDNNKAPIIGSFSLQYPSRYFDVSLKVSQVMRFPTFNELYWQPGGNSSLKPERGLSTELSISSQEKDKPLHIKVTAYHRRVKNWILWRPLEDSFIWAAQNIAEVESAGIDANSSYTHILANANIILNSGINYGYSKNLIDIISPTTDAGTQLPYTPKFKIYFDGKVTAGKWTSNINSRYTGAVTAANTILEPYWLTDASLGYTFSTKGGFSTELSLLCENLFNKNYRVVERRQMPSRQFRINLNLIF